MLLNKRILMEENPPSLPADIAGFACDTRNCGSHLGIMRRLLKSKVSMMRMEEL